jgi:hypothetical protein
MAYELYEQQGYKDGNDVQNWLNAEKKVKKNESDK